MDSIDQSDRTAYNDLGRRLFAAWWSWRLGNRGMDRVMKKYVAEDGPVGGMWIEIARKLDDYVSDVTSDRRRP